DGDGRREVVVQRDGALHAIKWDDASRTLVDVNTNVSAVNGAQLRSGDVNGDGREDLIIVRTCPKVCVFVLLDGPNGIAPTDTLYWQHESYDSFAKWRDQIAERIWDFNGDGKADLLLFTKTSACSGLNGCLDSSRWRVLQSVGSAFVEVGQYG